MMGVSIALLVLVGTSLQMVTSLRELRVSHRKALDWMQAEDALIDAERPWRRRRVRRELRSWRDPETHQGIAHVTAVLMSWVLLVVASAVALMVALTES